MNLPVAVVLSASSVLFVSSTALYNSSLSLSISLFICSHVAKSGCIYPATLGAMPVSSACGSFNPIPSDTSLFIVFPCPLQYSHSPPPPFVSPVPPQCEHVFSYIQKIG